MATLPEFLTDQTYEVILEQMLNEISDEWDKNPGSFIFDPVSAAAIQFTLAAEWAQEVLRRGFASTTFGDYLDLRAEEHGLYRREAVKSKGKVTFFGVPGTPVPVNSVVSTTADPGTNTPSVEYVTKSPAVLDGTGQVTVDIEAVLPGKSGDVAAGAINLLVTPITGISSVSNLEPTSGGLDREDDASFLQRYLKKVQSPSAGGNKADYVNWALEVPGVGGVSVIPVEDGPGTVNIYIIDTNQIPASLQLIDDVQNYIAPPQKILDEDTNWTTSGFGVSVDNTQPNTTDGSSIKMVYDGGGTGLITRNDFHLLLPQPGIWTLRFRVKVDSNTATDDLISVGVWNLSTGSWAKKSPSSAEDAYAVFKASDLLTSFNSEDSLLDYRNWETLVKFYWNGTDLLEWRVERLQTDTTTTIWIDNAISVSTFSKDDGSALAPIGAVVSVRSAEAVVINVSATLVISPGYEVTSVKNAVIDSITNYIKGLAFQSSNDVVYSRIGQAILETPGVSDYSNLIVNGGTTNIPITEKQVAVVGAVTLT